MVQSCENSSYHREPTATVIPQYLAEQDFPAEEHRYELQNQGGAEVSGKLDLPNNCRQT